MNLNEVLKVSKGLPPDSLHNLLFARKLANPLEEVTVSGVPPLTLENSAGKPVVDYRIYGNSVQNDTPTPENSVLVQSVGDLITEGEHTGMYKIPIVTSGKNLLNLEKLRTSTETNPVPAYKLTLRLKPNTRYTVSSDVPYNIGAAGTVYFNGNTFANVGVYKNNPITQTTDNNGTIYILVVKNRDYEKDVISGKYYLMLEEGTTTSPYEAYHNPITTSIYLDEPLETSEILKYPENIFLHADGTKETITLPKIPTFSGTNVITINTEIPPFNMEITYKARKQK